MNPKVKVLFFPLCALGVYVAFRGYASVSSGDEDTSLCACDKCAPEDDQWFLRRFNKSVEPFLTEKSNLSEDAFKWWKGLQIESRDFSTYNKTVSKLFQIFPPTPDVLEPSPDRCRTCAVVGNSNNLKRSRYGPLIDFHDFIFRINRGQTKGFEADVGSRTTHRVVYPESAEDLDNSTHLVLFPFKILDLEWLIQASTTGFSGKSYAPVKANIKANKDLVMAINPAFMRYTHDAWLEKKGRYPSTGFMTVVLALHICDEVNVFGFGADSDGNWSHYWEKLGDKNLKTGEHPGNDEYKIIQELARKEKLTFYTGW